MSAPSNVVSFPNGEARPAFDTRRAIAAILESAETSQKRAAKEMGISAAALSQWLAEKYEGDNAAIALRAEQWMLDRARRADMAAIVAAPAFVNTSVAKKIVAAFDHARVNADMVEIIASSGAGKTTVANQYARTHRANIWIATMRPDCSGVTTSLEEIGYAIAVASERGIAKHYLFRNLVSRIRGSRGLIIVDEAQHLKAEALDEIRSLHDASGVGIALMGSDRLHMTMTGGMKRGYMSQTYSRLGVRLNLSAPPATNDLDLILDAWGVEKKAERELLAKISAKPGALRLVAKTIRLARMSAAADERKRFSLDDLEDAWKTLGSGV